MIARTTLISFLLLSYIGLSQEVSLPADLRQHALTQYNASLFNPTFSLDRNNPQSVSFWTRWQWQQVDADPTTLFLNYSRKINEKSGFGAGFFQHNTGIYFNTGGVVNYAYEVRLNPIIRLSVGANLFGFQQQLADTRFIPDPEVAPFPLDISDDFILQLAPGFNLSVENFSLSMASENLFDYNVTDKGANTETADKIFMGMASYDFPVMASDSTAFLRPSIYLRTIPEQQNQIGINALFSTQKYWGQTGYNNFYGISVGAGGTFFNRVSLGALVEFGTSASLNTKDASFEIIASYYLGNPQNRRPAVVNVFDALDDDVVLLNEEEKEDLSRKELINAQKGANTEAREEDEEVEKTLDELSATKQPTALVDKQELSPPKEVLQTDKKEAKKLAAEERKRAKDRKKDSLDQVKKEKEELALVEKKAAENLKIAEAEAQKKKEHEAILAAEEAKRIAALNEKEKRQAAAEEMRRAEALAEAERLSKAKTTDSIETVNKLKALAVAEKLKAKKIADSIADAKKNRALALAEEVNEQQKQDSILKAKTAVETVQVLKKKQSTEVESAKEEVTPQAGEKYEEVATEDGLAPGFYLIANVFGTKKYFEAFVQDLRKKGIEPGSFSRSTNGYNYVYLKSYSTIKEARSARDTNFGGNYQGKTWIFRVVGE